MKKQIAFGALLSYFSIALNIIAGLIYTPWMVAQIGQSNYGIYTLANSIIGLFIIDFGLSSATARFMSKYIADGEYGKAQDFLNAIYKLYLLIDAVIFSVLVVLFFFLEHIYTALSPAELAQLKNVYIIVALYSVVQFPFLTQNGILTAHEKFIQLKLADVIYRIVFVGGTVFALWMGLGLYALVLVNALSGLLVIAYKAVAIFKWTPSRIYLKGANPSVYKEVVSFSSWTTVSSLAQRLVFGIIPTVLGIVSHSTEIAVFGVVTTIEGYFYTITSAINGLFMPKIARIYAGKEKQTNIMPLLLSVGKLQFFLNGLLVIGFFVLGHSFVGLWMGPDYIAAHWGVLLVVLPSMFLNTLQIANTAMIVENKVRIRAIIDLLTGVLSFLLAFPLAKFWGMLGGCIAISVAYSCRAILYHIAHQKIMHIDIWHFAKKCYLKMSPPAVLTLACGLALNYFIRDAGWLVFLIKGCLVVAVYCVSMFMLGLSRDEKRMVKETILKHTATKGKA